MTLQKSSEIIWKCPQPKCGSELVKEESNWVIQLTYSRGEKVRIHQLICEDCALMFRKVGLV